MAKNISEIRKKDLEIIKKDLKSKQIELGEEKMLISMQKTQKFTKLRNLKKEIAVLYTIKKEKEVFNA